MKVTSRKALGIIATLILLCSGLVASKVFTAGYPHTSEYSVECSSCHFTHNGLPGLLPPETANPSGTIEETPYNNLCWSCHFTGGYASGNYATLTHSNITTTSGQPYAWSVECIVCHDTHTYEQAEAYPDNALFEGGITAFDNITYLTITDDTANWTLDQFKGFVVFPDKNQLTRRYKIAGNSTDTLTIDKAMSPSVVQVGNTFIISRSKLLRKEIDRSKIYYDDPPVLSGPNPGLPQIDGPTGQYFYADGDGNGFCEVCHTNTKHYRNDGTGNPVEDPTGDHTNVSSGLAAPGNNCIICHLHQNGFSHSGGGGGRGCTECHNSGNHSIHLIQGKLCSDCHGDSITRDENGDILFTDSQLLGGTNVCINCHNSKPGWGETATACLTCHEISQGNRAAVGQQFEGNSHHVQGEVVTDAHCYECHWEARKVAGVVTGQIDTNYHAGETQPGAVVNLVVYGVGIRPEVYEAGATNTTAIQYLADNSRAQIESINTHCLGCHSDKNINTQPFGDCKTPTRYAWDSMSIDARYSQSDSDKWVPSAGLTNKGNIKKAFSAHGNAAGNAAGWNTAPNWINTTGAVNVACFDCHNSHGSTVDGVTTSYNSETTNGGILKDTSAPGGGYAMRYKPSAGGTAADRNLRNPGASLCFDCHLTQNSGTTPWGYGGTFGASQAIKGYLDTDYFGPGTFGTEQTFPYKALSGGHKGGHFGASTPGGNPMSTTPVEQINGLCTPCHDPHGVSPTFGTDQKYAFPLLKGTWVTSVNKYDGAPLKGAYRPQADYRWQANASNPGFDKTNTTEEIENFAGLCLRCHPQSELDPDTDSTWASVDRIHDSVKGWGDNPLSPHTYSCAKCHAPHNARMPRLMVTNCLQPSHRGRVASGSTFGSGSYVRPSNRNDGRGGGYGSGSFIQGGGHGYGGEPEGNAHGYYYWSGTGPCHVDNDAGQKWNNVTRW